MIPAFFIQWGINSSSQMRSQASVSLLLLLLVPLLLLLLAFVPCAYAAPRRTSGPAFASRRNDDQDAPYALQVIVASSSFLKLVHTVSQGACDRRPHPPALSRSDRRPQPQHRSLRRAMLQPLLLLRLIQRRFQMPVLHQLLSLHLQLSLRRRVRRGFIPHF